MRITKHSRHSLATVALPALRSPHSRYPSVGTVPDHVNLYRSRIRRVGCDLELGWRGEWARSTVHDLTWDSTRLARNP
jgi:hypothetical protein